MATRQLRVSAKSADSFRQNLRDGVFSIILEYDLPSTEQPLMMAAEPGVNLMDYARGDKRICSLIVTDGLHGESGHALVEVVQLLRKTGRRKDMLVGLSGRGLNTETLREDLTELAARKISAVSVHTGHGLPDHPADRHGRPQSAPELYVDSCRLLNLVRQKWPDVFLGAGVNPFKYTILESHLQYYKMMRKLATGAEFLTANVGWDMPKYHELQWYQRHRNIDEPVIARLLLLRRRHITAIMAHDYPGVSISRELGARVQRAADDGADGVTEQIERLARQAAGCRLMGYSGVQLAGIYDPETAEAVVEACFNAFEEFPDFDSWIDGWDEMNHAAPTAPINHGYYAFERLLAKGHLDFDPDKTSVNPRKLPPPSRGERWRYQCARNLKLGASCGPLRRLARRWLCHWQPGHDWKLERTMLQCAAQCPKGLELGACSGSRVDGSCEFGHRPCFYHSVLRLAQWQQKLERVENSYDGQ